MPWFRSLPNLITAARLLLAVPLGLAILARDWFDALVVVAIAGISDGLDGYLARRYGWQTALGARLDPIADKLLLGTAYIALGIAGALPVWLVVLVFARDLAILAFALWAWVFRGVRRFPPTFWGKLSTTLQIAAALVALGTRAGIPAVDILMMPAVVLAAAGTAWSWVHYAWVGVAMLRQAQKAGTTPRPGSYVR